MKPSPVGWSAPVTQAHCATTFELAAADEPTGVATAARPDDTACVR